MSVVRRSWTQDSDGYRYSSYTRTHGGYNRERTRQYDQYGVDPVSSANSRRDRSSGDKDDYDSSRRLRRSRQESAPSDYGDDGGQRRSRSQRESRYRPSQDRRRPPEEQQPQQQRNQNQQQPQQQRNQNQQQQSSKDEGDDSEEEGGFISRNFDGGFDGVITGVAGAALGAITARHFGGPKDFSPEAERQRQQDSTTTRVRKNWRTIVGAAVGAVGANAAQSMMKRKLEDEHQEHFAEGGEFLGEMMAAVGPDVL